MSGGYESCEIPAFSCLPQVLAMLISFPEFLANKLDFLAGCVLNFICYMGFSLAVYSHTSTPDKEQSHR